MWELFFFFLWTLSTLKGLWKTVSALLGSVAATCNLLSKVLKIPVCFQFLPPSNAKFQSGVAVKWSMITWSGLIVHTLLAFLQILMILASHSPVFSTPNSKKTSYSLGDVYMEYELFMCTTWWIIPYRRGHAHTTNHCQRCAHTPSVLPVKICESAASSPGRFFLQRQPAWNSGLAFKGPQPTFCTRPLKWPHASWAKISYISVFKPNTLSLFLCTIIRSLV